jgi:hypothetical protein
MQHKLEEYSRKSKMIMNKRLTKLKEHMIKKPQRLHKFKLGGKEIVEDFSPYV